MPPAWTVARRTARGRGASGITRAAPTPCEIARATSHTVRPRSAADGSIRRYGLGVFGQRRRRRRGWLAHRTDVIDGVERFGRREHPGQRVAERRLAGR